MLFSFQRSSRPSIIHRWWNDSLKWRTKFAPWACHEILLVGVFPSMTKSCRARNPIRDRDVSSIVPEISKWARREKKKKRKGKRKMLLEMSESIAVHFIFQHGIRRILKHVSKLDKQYDVARPRFWKILVAMGDEIVAQSCSREVGRGTIMIDDKNRDVYEYIALFACQWVMVERSIVPHDWYDARPQHARQTPTCTYVLAIDRLCQYLVFLDYCHQCEIFLRVQR